MLYRFKSPATGDLVMLQQHGDQLLRIIGREPAASGILLPQAMPQALASLRAAMDAPQATSAPTATDEPADPDSDESQDPQEQAVGLRQRAWPFMQMIEQARQADKEIVWGV